jgi:hypothetical protein
MQQHPQQQQQQQHIQMQQHHQQHHQQQYSITATTAAATGYQSYGSAAGATPVMASPNYAQYNPAPVSAAAVQQAQKPVVTNTSVWTEHKTEDGITYWHNCSTGVSQVSFTIVHHF